MSDFEFSAPVIVAGGGACGAVAALAARELGVEVLLIEQDATPRGSTAMSQGLICAAGTRAQRTAGVDDDPERFFTDIVAKTRGLTDLRLARAIADGAGPCIDWLMDVHGLPFELDVRFRAAYGHTRARVHGWLGRGGDNLIQFLHQRLVETGVDVLLSARLTGIETDSEGKVLGVALTRPDGAIERIGCEALILATSGFAANEAMVAKYMPELAGVLHHCHEGNRGDGIAMARGLGAAVADMGSYQGYAMLAEPHGLSVPPGQLIEGGVLINARGERFVDEANDIAGMLHAVQAQPGGRAWALYDAEIEQRCAYIPETAQLIALGAVKEADTVETLAAATGSEAAVIAASLDGAWKARRASERDSLGRDWSAASPPTPPYRAVRVRGALYHTQGGLQVDGEGRVLKPDGRPFPNLFAGGGTARGVSGPSYWGYLPAMGLCAAITLGRACGRAAAVASSVASRA